MDFCDSGAFGDLAWIFVDFCDFCDLAWIFVILVSLVFRCGFW